MSGPARCDNYRNAKWSFHFKLSVTRLEHKTKMTSYTDVDPRLCQDRRPVIPSSTCLKRLPKTGNFRVTYLKTYLSCPI